MKIEEIKIEDILSGNIYKADFDSEEIVLLDTTEPIKENSGYYLISGEVLLNNGNKYPALFGISSNDGGEMFEYYIYDKINNVVINHTDEINKILKISKDQVFPFMYHLSIKVEGDLHIEDQY